MADRRPVIPPRQPVTSVLRELIHRCDMAVDYELLCQTGPRVETPALRSHRIVETAIMYAIENGLLVVSRDLAENLTGYHPAQRAAP